MKLFVGTAFLIAASTGFAQMPVKKITVDIPAGPAFKAVDAIGKQIEVPLLIDKSMQKDIVVVHVVDAPANELMEKLAIAVSGRWSQEGQSWRLMPDISKRNAEAKAETDQRAIELLKSVVQLETPTAAAAGPGKNSPEAQKRTLLYSQANRARAGIVRMIGIQNLASILPGDRVVYSTVPTAMQKLLTINSDVISTLVNYHNEFKATSDKNSVENFEMPPGTSPELAELMKFMQRDMNRKAAKITLAPVKVLVAASFGGSSGFMGLGSSRGPQLKLRMYSADGKVVFEDDLLQNGLFGLMATGVAAPTETDGPPAADKQEDKPAVPDNSPKIEFSERAKLILKNGGAGVTVFNNPDTLTESANKLKAYFLKPIDVDPLELVHGEAIRNYALQKKVNLVACLRDNLFIESQITDGFTVQMVEKILKNENIFSTKEDGGWVVSTPRLAATARRERLDRLSLQSALAAAQGKPELSLDEVANFAFANPHANENLLLTSYISYGLKGLVLSASFSPVDWNMMQFYGSLPATQRTLCRNGGRIGFSELGPDARNALNLMVYGASETNFESGPPPELPEIMKDNPFLARMFGGVSFMGKPHQSFLDEPTEFLPTGLPQSGFLQISSTKLTCMSPVDAKGQSNPLVSTVDIGEFALYQTMLASSSDIGWSPDLSKVKLGERTSMEFTFHLRPDVRFKKSAQDDVYSNNKIYSVGDMPADIEKALAAKREKLKFMESLFGGMGGFGGGSIKPPLH